MSEVSPSLFYKTKALSQTCEMFVSRVNCVMECERGFAKFCIVPDLRMFVFKLCRAMGEASLTICMTKAWLSFASLFLESIVTSAAGEISDSVVGINYPAESRIRVIQVFIFTVIYVF